VNTIRWRLLAWLLPAITVTLAVAAFASYRFARDEVDELFDYQLRVTADALRDQSFLSLALDTAPPEAGEYGVLVQVWDRARGIVFASRHDRQLPLILETGFHNIAIGGAHYRVYSLARAERLIQVAQPMALRAERSAEIAFRNTFPYAILLPLTLLLAWLAVGVGLRPLERLAAELRARSPDSLTPLALDHLPGEIRPLVGNLNDLLLRLEHALRAQRSFIADAAHELRSPMTALRLQLELAQQSSDAQARANALAALRGGLDRSIRLIEQLLTLARLDPDAPSRTQPVELADVARTVVAERAVIAGDAGVDLGLAGAEAVLVSGDADALAVLLGNLVDNALRYTPRGGRVDVAIRRDGARAIVEVIDGGPGIPADERERVFDRFYRAGGDGATGSGLGLAIVRRIAERHGAEIRLEDGPHGRGLAVRVAFPVT
jgi:two-component system OmpR family sensor kinase